jgi:hypothetical protein
MAAAYCRVMSFRSASQIVSLKQSRRSKLPGQPQCRNTSCDQKAQREESRASDALFFADRKPNREFESLFGSRNSLFVSPRNCSKKPYYHGNFSLLPQPCSARNSRSSLYFPDDQGKLPAESSSHQPASSATQSAQREILSRAPLAIRFWASTSTTQVTVCCGSTVTTSRPLCFRIDETVVPMFLAPGLNRKATRAVES